MVCKRYIDDTFLLLKPKTYAIEYLHYLNLQHNSIKFIIEAEKDNTLSFLDDCVHKINNTFTCSWYRKSTYSGLGMDYFGFSVLNFSLIMYYFM